ncbi:MAG: type II secretion system protein GspG [Acidobacteria bacterium]|nr:type II secretion system protein GspG [Acidobacteriota bacterium]
MTVLTALSILSAAAAPAVSDYVEQAQLLRATQDVRTIAVVLTRLFNDVSAERDSQTGWASYDLLVGAGAVPGTRGVGTEMWAAAVREGSGGMLDDHLVTNAAGYTRRAGGAVFGWRGSYLQQRVQPDPWGHRYAVNVRAMNAGAHTVVLSAGPDGVVDSPFESDALPTAGDDIVAVLSSGWTGYGQGTRR